MRFFAQIHPSAEDLGSYSTNMLPHTCMILHALALHKRTSTWLMTQFCQSIRLGQAIAIIEVLVPAVCTATSLTSSSAAIVSPRILDSAKATSFPWLAVATEFKSLKKRNLRPRSFTVLSSRKVFAPPGYSYSGDGLSKLEHGRLASVGLRGLMGITM